MKQLLDQVLNINRFPMCMVSLIAVMWMMQLRSCKDAKALLGMLENNKAKLIKEYFYSEADFEKALSVVRTASESE